MAERAIHIKLDDRTWWNLATLAEQRGITISDLIEQKVHELVPDPEPIEYRLPSENSGTSARGDAIRRRITELHTNGYTDTEMAALMHCQPSTIWYHRRILRLGPNPRRVA